MKKYFLLLLTTLPVIALAQKKADTITLKNGKSVAGVIYKMDDGKIYVADKDSAVYTADEVQTIMFCHDSKNDCNTTVTSSNTKQAVVVSNNESNANGTTIVFKCNQCGNNGSLKISGGTKDSRSTSNYAFNGERFTQQKERLVPGEYTWSYSDINKKEISGKFTIRKGEEKEIVLFENN